MGQERRRAGLFLAFAVALSVAACAGRAERREESGKRGEEKTAAAQPAEPGLGEERQSTGKSSVKSQEQVVVERNTDVPVITSTRVGADINRMNIDQFIAVGFPQDIARNIVVYRNEHGPFQSVDALKGVPGMNEELFKVHAGKLAVRAGEVRPTG